MIFSIEFQSPLIQWYTISSKEVSVVFYHWWKAQNWSYSFLEAREPKPRYRKASRIADNGSEGWSQRKGRNSTKIYFTKRAITVKNKPQIFRSESTQVVQLAYRTGPFLSVCIYRSDGERMTSSLRKKRYINNISGTMMILYWGSENFKDWYFEYRPCKRSRSKHNKSSRPWFTHVLRWEVMTLTIR